MTQATRTLAVSVGLVATSAVVGLLLIELLFVPMKITRGLDRSLALMGFYAPPGLLIDDTAINEDGFTGHRLEAVHATSTSPRILTLGGSTMFNRRMTERMISAWQESFPEPPLVVGAALRTHTTRASVIKYQYHFSRFDFDYVLIYHGINDLWANNVEPLRFRDDYSHQNPWGRRNLLLDHLMIARLVFNHRNPPSGAFPEESNQAGFLASSSFENNLRALIEDIRQRDGIPVLMTFAWHIPEHYSHELFQAGALAYNNPTRYDYCPVELWGSVEYVQEGLQHHNEIIRRLARELGVALVDQFANLSADIENFGDPVHFSEPGTDRFIAALTHFFAQELPAAGEALGISDPWAADLAAERQVLVSEIAREDGE